MKLYLYSILFLSLLVGSLYGQNVVFSYSVNNSSPTQSVVSVFAEGTSATNTEMTTFGIRIYYNSAEASITLPSGVSYQGATNFGWNIGTNSTSSNTSGNNPNIPILHTHFVEVAPFDEDLAGDALPMTPTLFFTLTFSKSPGNPSTGGQIYLGATDTDPSLAAADENLDPFNVVAIGERTQLLPLNLLNFNAVKFGEKSSQLTWTTLNEKNTSHFLIQRSVDQKNWYDVGSIGAAGYSFEVKNYSFLDSEVYNGIDSRLQVYYRLKMVDIDGRFTNSPLKSVVFTGIGGDISRQYTAYPNPSSEGLWVEWDASGQDQPSSLEFFDIHGKLAYSVKVDPKSNQQYIDFSETSIIPGLYILRILGETEVLDHKQIVVDRR